MLHLPVTLNPKELVGDMSVAVLFTTFPCKPSVSSLGLSRQMLHMDLTELGLISEVNLFYNVN